MVLKTISLGMLLLPLLHVVQQVQYITYLRRALKQCGNEQGRSRERRQGANVIPGRPAAQVGGPKCRPLSTLWLDRRERIVQGDIERDGDHNSSEQVQQATGEHQGGAGLI